MKKIEIENKKSKLNSNGNAFMCLISLSLLGLRNFKLAKERERIRELEATFLFKKVIIKKERE